MNIAPLFTDADIDDFFLKFNEIADKKLYTMLQAAGEVFIKLAREDGNYKDKTGNLRSSIGYVIVLDGEIVNENYQLAKSGTDKESGLSTAKRLTNDVAKLFNYGYVLIGVAGMKYAAYVEAIEGVDVISGASIQCETWLKKSIETVLKKIDNGNYK